MPSEARPVSAPLWRRSPFVLLALVCLTLTLYSRSWISVEVPLSVHHDTILSCSSDDPIRRVAIVGAGSGGSSAAYYIDKYSQQCPNVRITVYERNGFVGGRSTTVHAYDDLSEPVELGASVFVKVNHNLMHAVKRFGLVTQEGFDPKQKDEDDDLDDVIGVYDGQAWRYISPYDPAGGWWTIVKLLWQYGMDPIRTRNLMKSTVGRFLKMYEEPVFPFSDLTQAVRDVGLADEVAVTGAKHVEKHGVSKGFAMDIIQASTRVNYASNLNAIHGVETMVCMATDGAMSVQGGNWQIFASMLEHSGAHVIFNTTVDMINRESDGTFTVLASNVQSEDVDRATYDTVILASPFQFSNITLSPPSVIPISEIPYVILHVTIFTSPYRLNPQAFNLAPDAPVPKTVLTTTNPDTEELQYNSISTLRSIKNPKSQQREYLYKIFSPAPLKPSFLNSILALPSHSPSQELNVEDPTIVTWVHRKMWHSYPVEHPRSTFEETKYSLQGGGEIWYTSSIEPFISTMETSSLMGMNVARLVVEGWKEDRRSLKEAQGSSEDNSAGVESEL